jgi:hypothetical protein
MEIHHVSAGFRDKPALRDVSFQVFKGCGLLETSDSVKRLPRAVTYSRDARKAHY